jgi:hypothetical protein
MRRRSPERSSSLMFAKASSDARTVTYVQEVLNVIGVNRRVRDASCRFRIICLESHRDQACSMNQFNVHVAVKGFQQASALFDASSLANPFSVARFRASMPSARNGGSATRFSS